MATTLPSRGERDAVEARPVTRSVVVAGASGFVGQAVGSALAARGFQPIGLSRSERNAKPYAFRRCDLFSLLDVERGLRGADYAVYLAHSMMPSARLTQGHFSDLDFVCADNFARAAAAAGVRHIVYLGGIVPEGQSLSAHLRSRLEIERILASYGTPVTTLRAGLILGAEGSSFQIMVRLVRRLPAMLCPSWTNTRTQPADVRDVAELIALVLGDERCMGRAFDVGVDEVLTYRTMMERVGEKLGLRRPNVSVPFLSPRLSRLWLSLITGAPKELAAPLVESLKHEMVARDRTLYDLLERDPPSFDDALDRALVGGLDGQPTAFSGPGGGGTARVRSVQRLEIPRRCDASWAAEEYMRWLPVAMWPFVRVEVDEAWVSRFYVRGIDRPLLVLALSRDRSSPDRQLFYVEGGLLSADRSRGRLEFRTTPDGDALICALHEFEPRLPWFIYRLSQAQAHLFVMWRFGRHLRRVLRSGWSPATADMPGEG